MFCKNCGMKNDSDKKFCKSCGTPLTNISESSEDVHSTDESNVRSSDMTEQVGTVSSESKAEASNVSQSHHEHSKVDEKQAPKKMNKSTKVWLSVIAAVFVVLFGTYKFAENYYSYENQQERYIETIKAQDAKAYSDAMVSNHPGFEVTEASIQPLVDYFKGNSQGYNDMLRHLKQETYNFNNQDMLYIAKDGKYFGMFDRYQLFVTPVEFIVLADVEDAVIVYNDTETEEAADVDYTHFGPVAPGTHKVSVKATVADKDIEETISQDVLSAGYAEEIYFDFDTIQFVVNTDVDQAEIYQGDYLLGNVKDAKGEIGPILWEEGIVLTFKTTLESGELVEKDIALEEGRNNYNVQVFPDVSSYDVERMINKTYQASSDLSYEETEDRLESVASYLVNGKDNDLFTTFKNTGKKYRDNDDISGVYYSIDLLDYELTDLSTLAVKYELDVNEYGSGGSSFELVFNGTVKITDDGSYMLESAALAE